VQVEREGILEGLAGVLAEELGFLAHVLLPAQQACLRCQLFSSTSPWTSALSSSRMVR